MKQPEIFSIDEESDSGGISYCRVTKKRVGYYLWGTELGEMCGPCETVCDALNESGFQFGMDYMDIKCKVTEAELREILHSPAFLLENVSHLTLNGEVLGSVEVEDIVAAYHKMLKK